MLPRWKAPFLRELLHILIQYLDGGTEEIMAAANTCPEEEPSKAVAAKWQLRAASPTVHQE
eukprot:769564-Lingulodinium_polyedra.AAC.1